MHAITEMMIQQTNPGNAVLLSSSGNEFDYPNAVRLLVSSICVVTRKWKKIYT